MLIAFLEKLRMLTSRNDFYLRGSLFFFLVVVMILCSMSWIDPERKKFRSLWLSEMKCVLRKLELIVD